MILFIIIALALILGVNWLYHALLRGRKEGLAAISGEENTE